MPIISSTQLINDDEEVVLQNVALDDGEVVLTVDDETEVRISQDLWEELVEAVQAQIDAAAAAE
jgi:hypothetical protein